MGRAYYLSSHIKAEIIALHEAGNLKQSEIANKVQCSQSNVCKVIQKFRNKHSTDAKLKPGRPFKCTTRALRCLKPLMTANTRMFVRGIAKHLCALTEKPISKFASLDVPQENGVNFCAAKEETTFDQTTQEEVPLIGSKVQGISTGRLGKCCLHLLSNVLY